MCVYIYIYSELIYPCNAKRSLIKKLRWKIVSLLFHNRISKNGGLGELRLSSEWVPKRGDKRASETHSSKLPVGLWLPPSAPGILFGLWVRGMYAVSTRNSAWQPEIMGDPCPDTAVQIIWFLPGWNIVSFLFRNRVIQNGGQSNR